MGEIMNLNGKGIIITGTASGIGKSLVEQLLVYDVKILAVDKVEQPWLIDQPQVIPLQCDFSSQDNVDRAFQVAEAELGSVDIFIGNAGFGYYEKIIKENWQRIEKIFQTNVFACIYAAQKMSVLNSNRKYIVAFTSSTMVEFPIPGYALYTATKSALDGFARTYRHEMSNNSKLVMVYPITTKTQFFKTAGNNRPLEWPLQTPDQVAKAIIRGIEKEKASVYPSKVYSWGRKVSAVIPLIPKMYMKKELGKLDEWHHE